MQWRILSAALFTFGFLVMAVSDFTTFFGFTPVTEPLTAGFAIFGFLLCLFAFFLLSAGAVAPGRSDLQWNLYGLILFLSGLFHMGLGTLRIFFGLTRADMISAVLALLGGLVLCVVGAGSQSLRQDQVTEEV